MQNLHRKLSVNSYPLAQHPHKDKHAQVILLGRLAFSMEDMVMILRIVRMMRRHPQML